MRWLAVPAVVLAAGCGGKEGPAAADAAFVAEVKACLEDKGLRVVGGPGAPSGGDDDAPDRGELIAAGAFIAFYSSEERAEELAAGIRDNAERIGASVARRRAVTIVYTERGAEEEIDDCLGS